MFTKRIRTITCFFLCVCLISLNLGPVSAATGKPRPKPPGDKIPPKERPEKPNRPEKPGPGDKIKETGNQRVIEYVRNMKQKNAFIPVFAQLAQRHLSGASDKTELDKIFDKAMQKCPGMKDKLPQFIEAYNAIPMQLKNKKFIMPDVQKDGKASTAGISNAEFESMLIKSFPDKVQSMPEQIYSKKKMIKKKVSPWVDTPFDDTEVALIEYVEKPRITHLTPTGREPGETLTIYGMNFQAGKTHKVILTYKDVENSESEYYEETAVSSSQIDFDIPDDIIPGNYRVEIKAPGMMMVGPGEDSTPISDPASYEVGTPKYKVYFNKMKCIDETRGTNNENIYKDSLVTFWGIGADERGWFKHSKKYKSFEDGTSMPYEGSDQHVLTPGDNYNKVQYGMVISVDLYEWNWTDVESGDSDEVLDWAYCFFEEMASNNAWGDTIIGMLLDLVALILTPLVDMWVNLFTADPRHIENEILELSALDLQSMLKPGESTTGLLNFKGQDGEYDIRYTIKRQ